MKREDMKTLLEQLMEAHRELSNWSRCADRWMNLYREDRANGSRDEAAKALKWARDRSKKARASRHVIREIKAKLLEACHD